MVDVYIETNMLRDLQMYVSHYTSLTMPWDLNDFQPFALNYWHFRVYGCLEKYLHCINIKSVDILESTPAAQTQSAVLSTKALRKETQHGFQIECAVRFYQTAYTRFRFWVASDFSSGHPESFVPEKWETFYFISKCKLWWMYFTSDTILMNIETESKLWMILLIDILLLKTSIYQVAN